MNRYRAIFSSRADDQLVSIYRYIAAQSSPEIAQRYVDAIAERCHALATFPHRGSRRDDLQPGVRTIDFRRRVTIAPLVEPGEVRILGIFYAGQDFEALLRDE